MIKKGVILIENRTELIKPTIDKHFQFLPNDWELKIYDQFKIENLEDYNNIMTSFDFWNNIPFDKVLVIQHDSELLREGIEDFLEFDYVGAPWKFQEHGGNGGLSLRSKNAMLGVTKHTPYCGSAFHGYEDVYFSNQMQNLYKLAPREICSQFSCETIFQLGTFGAHAIDKYMTQKETYQIRTQYLKK